MHQSEAVVKQVGKKKRRIGTITTVKPIPIEILQRVPHQRYQQQYISIRKDNEAVNDKTEMILQQYQSIINSLIRKNQILNGERNTLIRQNVKLKMQAIPHSESVLCSIISQHYVEKQPVVQRPRNSIAELYTLNSLGSRQKIFIDESPSALSDLSNLPSSHATPSSKCQPIIEIEGVEEAMSKQTIKSYYNQHIQQLSIFQRDPQSNSQHNRDQTPTLNQHQHQHYTISEKVGKWVEVVRCPSDAMYAPFRCFYLSILTHPTMREKMRIILQQLSNDHNTEYIIKGLLQNNLIWINIASNFLQNLQSGELMGSLLKEGSDGERPTIMKYLNSNKLIDMTMIAILRHRLQYMFQGDSSPSHHEQFNALANQFDLQINLMDNTYEFYDDDSHLQQQFVRQDMLMSGCQSLKASQRHPVFRIYFNQAKEFYEFEINHQYTLHQQEQTPASSSKVFQQQNENHNYSFQQIQVEINERQLIESEGAYLYNKNKLAVRENNRFALRQISSNQNINKYVKFSSTEKIDLRNMNLEGDQQNYLSQNQDIERDWQNQSY